MMALIGMVEAAKRMGMTERGSALRALKNAGVPLVIIHKRTTVVDEVDLQNYLDRAAEKLRPGRKVTPPKPDK